MKLCFILETREPPRPNPIIVEAAVLLEQRGACVEMLYPEQILWRLDSLKVEADLYLLKSDSELALSLAQSLEMLGACVLNPYDACLKIKDKTVAAGLMYQAGINTPQSYAVGNATQCINILQHHALILKPNRGYHGVGLSIVEDAKQLSAVRDYPDMVFAQTYLAKARKDLKIFGIGSEVFALRKPFSADSYKQSGIPTTLTPMHEIIARNCAATFGLSLYGIDLAEIEGDAYVVDINYFPGYRGVPDAARRLSDFIWNSAKEKQ